MDGGTGRGGRGRNTARMSDSGDPLSAFQSEGTVELSWDVEPSGAALIAAGIAARGQKNISSACEIMDGLRFVPSLKSFNIG